MKLLTTLLLFIALAGCKGRKTEANQPKDIPKSADSSAENTKITATDSLMKMDRADSCAVMDTQNEKQMMQRAVAVLQTIKKKNFENFSEFIHPSLGTRFSPYGHIDTLHDQQLSVKEFIEIYKKNKIIHWGTKDGSGAPIDTTVQGYFKQFVYDVDFLNAEKKEVNKFIGSGNSLNNLKEIYKGSGFVEFYFSGFDKKFQGMDWRCLRLVFKKHENNYYLTGVVHDQWTI